MASRLQLQQILQTIMGDNKVYYSPPETIKLTYPCIVYQEQGERKAYAEDKIYIQKIRYRLTLLDKDPDSPYRDIIQNSIPYCAHNSTYYSDNIVHFDYDLYY